MKDVRNQQQHHRERTVQRWSLVFHQNSNYFCQSRVVHLFGRDASHRPTREATGIRKICAKAIWARIPNSRNSRILSLELCIEFPEMSNFLNFRRPCSAVSTPLIAREGACFRIFRDLQDLHPFAPLRTENFCKNRSIRLESAFFKVT